MTTKNLSTSTLSLRFMQNAQRAKQLKEVELDRAEVKDDGRWEVSQAVRDSWGLSKEALPEPTDVHESSYLPFLFSAKSAVQSHVDAVDATVRKAAGRRIFNKKGQEVTLESTSSETTSISLSSPAPQPQSSGRKVHPRPISVSASGTSVQLRGFEKLKKPKDSKTARQAIFESGGVGTDLRAQARTDAIPSTSTSFMKPAGVDDPKDLQTAPAVVSSNRDEIINGARQKVKRERERDVTADPSDVPTKPKKKKKNPE